ncbi:YhdP family protein [Thauera butanivorans]|uniref:YhdP family protein n=1 Tax=Thauera butanivorans TaxID=86174 RepID=UPI003AB57913
MNPLSEPLPESPAPESPAARRARRSRAVLGRIGKVLVLGWIVVASAMLLLRHVVLPAVGEFHGEIAGIAGRSLGLPVAIEAIDGDWAGWRPRLVLQRVTLSDAEGRPALHLPRVDATLAWTSLLRGQAHFHRLEITAPELRLRRDADGRVFVAGLPVADGGGDGGGLDWLLAQRQIVIHDAVLRWDDRLRAAPELVLENVELRLDQRFGQRRFALRAQPPQALASTLDVRGELQRLDADAPLSLASAGRLYVSLDRADLGGWQPWLDYPLPLQGNGGVRAWLESRQEGRFALPSGLGLGQAAGRGWAVTADLALDGVRTQLGSGLPELLLERLDGRLSVERVADEYRLSTQGLALRTADGLALPPTDLELQFRGEASGEQGGRLAANRLDFDTLARLAAFLPLDEAVRGRLAAFAPQGRLEALSWRWDGAPAAPRAWAAAARFAGLGLLAGEGMPGLGGLSGMFDGDEQGGRYRLDSRDAHLDLPEVFESGRLRFDLLRAEGGWQRRGGRLEITLDSAQFDNADAAGNASGVYRPQAGSAGEIDLQARLTRAEGRAVWRYLPRVVGKETHDWVRDAIRRADVPEASLRLRGALDDFPFRDGNGEFRVAIRVVDGVLDYADGWPPIEGIFGEVRFIGPGMRIEAPRGRIFGVALSEVVVDMPELDTALSDLMTITGKAAGPTAEFLRFVSQSPVSARIGGFTDGMRAEGRGTLDLRLEMPLEKVDESRVAGEYRFGANRLWLVEGLPVLEGAAGRLRFTEDSLAMPEGRAQFLGAPARITARTLDDGTVRFDASGVASAAALAAAGKLPLAHLSGSTAWKAQVGVGTGGLHVGVESDLTGLASSLPAPLNKNAGESWPLNVRFDAPGGAAPRRLKLELAEESGMPLRAELLWPADGPMRGGLALNAARTAVPRLAERGLRVEGRFDVLDADAWRRVFDGEAGGGDGTGELPLSLADLSLQIGRLQIFGQTLSGFALHSVSDAGGWKARIDSDRAVGEFDWRDSGPGALRARFERLSIGQARETEDGGASEATAADVETGTPPRRLPALDVVAEQFMLGGRDLGRLEVSARNRAGVWQLERLGLRNADGQLDGSGEWRTTGQPSTRLDFELQVEDIGRFSQRLGYDDVVRGGKATLGGQLRWQGAPTRIHYPTLAGRMELAAEAGQFNKLEPGVGRLLGILSLQALPRRITLDFRDVFSAGFAFDGISGSIDVADGVMRTDDLEIRGPAARVRMRGSADVEAETQDLRVAVQPTLSESVAIGAAAGLLNPVAGVVTYLAQKALSDPIERLFAYEYEITGTWADPAVRRLGAAQPAPAE